VFAVRRGEGTFVAEEPARLKKSERSETLRDAATRYAGTALSVGATLVEAAAELEHGYDRVMKEHRRKA
jgi:hypothetical protein